MVVKVLPSNRLVAWLRRFRLKKFIEGRRKPTMKVRLWTVLLWLALLLGLHILLADWQSQTPYPNARGRARSRPGFAPRKEVHNNALCHGLPRHGESFNASQGVTKVLLVTYNRAGGSLVGQLFDKDVNTTFWSEPVDGILSDLYGTYHGWHPLDVFTNQEGHPRRVPPCEEEAIVQHLSSLLACQLGNIPIDILTATDAILPSWKTREYMPCLRQMLLDVKPHNNPTGYSANVALACKESIVEHCPKKFSFAKKTLYSCFDKIQDLKGKMQYLLNIVQGKEHRDGPLWVNFEPNNPFVEYGMCIASVIHHSKKCLPLFTKECTSSDMVVIKSSRLRGEQISRLMEAHSDLKVLYFVRDPRGIALSREKMGSLSEVSQANYVNEAVLLCQRMHYDLAHLNILKHRFPNRIMRLTYEDFLQDPGKAGSNVYSFLQKEMSAKVKGWLDFKMKQLEEVGPDGEVTLKNMTSMSFKFRRQMPTPDNDYIIRKCSHVLRELGYPLLK